MIWWPTEIPTLSYGNVTLRPSTKEDIEYVYRGCQDPYIPTVTRIPANYTMDNARQFINERDPMGLANKTELRFVIEYSGTLRTPTFENPGASSVPTAFPTIDYTQAKDFQYPNGNYFCGLISLHSINIPNHVAEIGYWLAYPMRGQGIASVASKIITDWGITTVGFRRIGAFVNVENISSRKVLENAGYEYEGTMKSMTTKDDDRQIDMAVFGATSKEWKSIY